MHDTSGLTENQKLVLMAAAVHGLGPETDLMYANARRVVRQALVWQGYWDQELDAVWNPYDGSPALEAVYGALLSLIKMGEPLFEGAGNLGSDSLPSAFPDFVSCRLTTRGQAMAEQLLAEQPRFGQHVYGYREPRKLPR
jgi:hypothetical protein